MKPAESTTDLAGAQAEQGRRDGARKAPARFELTSDFQPQGDQPQAIEQLVEGIERARKHQVLLGVTGSGKTFTMANVVARVNKPTLVLAHNKTLAAQLYQELKVFFPNNAVEYFVSYYDYYQPEAYVPSSDTYIEKDSLINDTIDRMRHSATRALLERNDVIIVASVSCIYGIGSRDSYKEMTAYVEVGRPLGRDSFLRQLVESQFERNDVSFARGTFRARGDVVEVFPAHEEEEALRISFFGDDVERIQTVDPLRGRVLADLPFVTIWPASHYAMNKERMQRTLGAIRDELQVRLAELKGQNLLLEAQRLEQRTMYDLEMLEATGQCKGIENYSRHLTGRITGEPPPTLLDYFPGDALFIIDESHQTMPQVRGMYFGDRSRKETLVRYGFRLPSALDNRPLKIDEFEAHVPQVVYVSATPADYEIEKAHGVIVEQLIRPTGLLDPLVELRPVATQVDDLIGEAKKTVAAGERVLVTVLTKRMAEDLTEYLQEVSVRARYLHSDIDTLERIELLSALRRGDFDVLVGINLLREGLDLPEVSLVAILDADKEGFLRATTGLIQTIGRAARNAHGRVILYADVVTDSIRAATGETSRRRSTQEAYNRAHGITPKTIQKAIRVDPSLAYGERDYLDLDEAASGGPGKKGRRRRGAGDDVEPSEIPALIESLRADMRAAAQAMEFERAAELRDRVRALEKKALL
ncbi:MAG: excinuclease ABC subunit UvrB [Deltaproteobacteria bacterium]|nr:excinuclease ABC subunit UvrB [Deltaproteobacteria bacterium]